MAKSKKTKIHKKIDGQLLQMNKSFNNLKMKQKDKITAWVYEEYKKYVTENEKVPDSEADEHIIDEVLDKTDDDAGNGTVGKAHKDKVDELRNRAGQKESVQGKRRVRPLFFGRNVQCLHENKPDDAEDNRHRKDDRIAKGSVQEHACHRTRGEG